MPHIPPLPTWDSLHPLIIHFPIVLLLLSPLFIVISAILRPSKGRPYMVSALILLLLGTSSLFIATSTGEAAAELADRGNGVDAVLANHENLAANTKAMFSGLSLLLLGIFVLPSATRREDTRFTSTVLPIAFLALYLIGVGILVNTAHAGGRLVHEFGVHAMMPSASPTAELPSSLPNTE